MMKKCADAERLGHCNFKQSNEPKETTRELADDDDVVIKKNQKKKGERKKVRIKS
jgi:hypothetical protein